MLLNENRGDRDQGACHGKRSLRSLAETLAMKGSERHRERADDMYRRADVGVGIECVVARHKPRQKIISLEFCGAQVLAGGEKEIDDYRRRIGYHDEIHHFLESRHIVYQRVNVHSDQIDEPEKIGDQKHLAKGDRVIERAIDRIIAIGAIDLFHKEEEKSVDRPIEEQPQVTGLIGSERSENESSKVKLGF